MKLSEGIIGEIYQVYDIHIQEETERRLRTLGMTKGTKLLLMNKKRNGSLIFKMRGTRFAVGKEIAEAIEIKGED